MGNSCCGGLKRTRSSSQDLKPWPFERTVPLRSSISVMEPWLESDERDEQHMFLMADFFQVLRTPHTIILHFIGKRLKVVFSATCNTQFGCFMESYSIMSECPVDKLRFYLGNARLAITDTPFIMGARPVDVVQVTEFDENDNDI